MNAIEIIDIVRGCDANVTVEGDQLVVRGRGADLPAEVQDLLHAHKAEVMLALGASHAASIASILDAIRPFLPRALKVLPDAQLLALVNWSIVHAWNAAGRRTLREPHEVKSRDG